MLFYHRKRKISSKMGMGRRFRKMSVLPEFYIIALRAVIAGGYVGLY